MVNFLVQFPLRSSVIHCYKLFPLKYHAVSPPQFAINSLFVHFASWCSEQCTMDMYLSYLCNLQHHPSRMQHFGHSSVAPSGRTIRDIPLGKPEVCCWAHGQQMGWPHSFTAPQPGETHEVLDRCEL